ncbi:MAG: type IX secretion system membrane protein PorP/SprF [Bacteroidales bacterium]|nr:type IX secretion system membrane protein PorP/SprF [Bacteroidales bacterium]
MNKGKIIFILFSVIGIGSWLRAQQLPLYSQYYFNPLLYNTACAGSSERFEIGLLYRNQWTGLDGAPKTSVLTIHGPLNMGSNLSSMMIADKVGAYTRFSVDLGFTYRLEVVKNIYWALGLSGQFANINVDGSLLTFNDNAEQVIPRIKESNSFFDFTASTFIHGEFFYAGFSIPQLLNGSVKFGSESQVGTLYRHFYAVGGVRIPSGEKSILEPHVLFKTTQGAPLQLDAGVRLELNERYWIGFVYRTRAALSISLGILMMDKVMLGYSYDYATTDLKNVYPSSHEIMLKYLFPKKKINYSSF